MIQADDPELKDFLLIEKARVYSHSQPVVTFNKDSFDRNKWNGWHARSSGLDGLGGYKDIDRNFYETKVPLYAKESNWKAVGLYVEGYIRATGERPNFILYPLEVKPPLSHEALVNRLYGLLRAAPGDYLHHNNGCDEDLDMDDCRRVAALNRQQLVTFLPYNDFRQYLGPLFMDI